MKKYILALLPCLILAFASGAFAADKEEEGHKDPKAKVEFHEKMADAHKKAAECLKDGKTEKECMEQFKKDRPECDCCKGKGHCKYSGKDKGKKKCERCHDEDGKAEKK